MDELEKILKKELKRQVDHNFTDDTMLYIQKKQNKTRFIIGIVLFLLSTILIPFIHFESIIIDKLPLIGSTFEINQIYVFVIFTFTLIVLIDTIFRSVVSKNQNNLTTK